MKVFVEITGLAATATRDGLRDRAARLVDAGATGVSVSDHLFATRPGVHRRDGVDPGLGRDPRRPAGPAALLP